MKKQILVLSVVILFFLTLSSSYAGVPMDTVQVHVDKVLKVLGDPKLKSPSAKEIKKEKLRIIFDEMFDKIELSRRTLGRNWNNLTSAQRAEFVDLFKQILEKNYADKLLEYTNEKVQFYKENVLSDNQAEVQSKIITSSKEIPIFYRVILKDGKWKVYDVIVENVSLVQNYRTQFNEILAKNPPAKLIDILRDKVSKN